MEKFSVARQKTQRANWSFNILVPCSWEEEAKTTPRTVGGVIKGQAQLSAHRQGSVWLSQSQLKKRETGKGSGDEDDSSVASLMRNAPTRANVGGIGRVRGIGGFHVWYIATTVALLNLRKAPAHGQSSSSAFAKKRLSRSCGPGLLLCGI